VPASPGGSSSAARRFMEETQKLGLQLVSPGRACVTARRFLENSRNLTELRWKTRTCNTKHLTIHDYIQLQINQSKGTPLTWISLLNLINLLLPPCLPISFLLFYQFRPTTSPNTHQDSPFMLCFWYSFNLAKTFPNTQILPFKRCFKIRSIMQNGIST